MVPLRGGSPDLQDLSLAVMLPVQLAELVLFRLQHMTRTQAVKLAH